MDVGRIDDDPGYDEADNLTLLDDDSGFSHFTHDSGNAVVEQSGDMVQRWVVDAAGQTREDAWNYYRWDSAGQLLGVKNKYSGLRTDFERDAQGRLIGSVSATERQATRAGRSAGRAPPATR